MRNCFDIIIFFKNEDVVVGFCCGTNSVRFYLGNCILLLWVGIGMEWSRIVREKQIE